VIEDRRAVACNYAEGISAVRAGAKCYVSLANPGAGDDPDRIQVLARSRGGRWIVKWEATKRLTNFRAVTIPPDHPLYDDGRIRSAGDADGFVARLDV
jgi:hypothetical protein